MHAAKKKRIVLSGFLFSLILHALLGAAFFISVKFDFADKNKQTIIKTRLVRLGVERKKELLPRKVAPVPRAFVENKTVKKSNKNLRTSTSKKKAVPKRVATKKRRVAQKKRGSKRAAPKRRPSAADRLSRLTKNWSKQGAKNGSPFGSEIRGRLEQEYQDQVAQAIRDSYELPSILSESERKNLEVMVKIKIGSQGRLIDISVLKPSRAPFFDNAVVQGAKGLGSFGPPPLQLRFKFARSGIQLKFCPLRCSKG